MSLSLPHIGALPAGVRNSIADVAGVTVGHATLAGGAIQTGVTVVRPHAGDPFLDKVPAASVVLNGFGKSIGLVQVGELGVLETPIALTNTFAVGAVAQAQIRQAVAANPQIGRAWSTVNPLVFECNDGYLNDLQAFAVQDVHYDAACAAAAQAFEQGAVGGRARNVVVRREGRHRFCIARGDTRRRRTTYGRRARAVQLWRDQKPDAWRA